MPKLAIIHTTPVTVAPLAALAAELLPGVRVVNFVDDSVLPQLAENGGDTGAVEPRLVQYGKFAAEVGADVVLSACSSVGALVTSIGRAVDIPVVRIDEAMAEAAVRRGRSIGVAATLATTLAPTLALLKAKAAELDKEVRLEPRCVTTAYERLLQGDREGHDAVLAEALRDLSKEVDVVVLAQASMARVLDSLPANVQDKFLTSPRLAMMRVRDVLRATA